MKVRKILCQDQVEELAEADLAAVAAVAASAVAVSVEDTTVDSVADITTDIITIIISDTDPFGALDTDAHITDTDTEAVALAV